MPELASALAAALVERPPQQPKDGAVFRTGFDAELDELAALQKGGAERMVELEARLKQETGIATRTVQLRLVSDSDAGDDELYLFHV